MKKFLIILFVALVLLFESAYPMHLFHTSSAQLKQIPSYAKWGTYAMKQTQEKYPNAKIMDYLHIGKINGPHSSTEKFKLWLKDNSREFGVYITIEFNNKTDKVIKVTFKESTK